MADQHNLTPVLARCMDRHLVFPLLEFLSQKALFDGADIQCAKIDLLQKTNMVDYAMDIYKELYGREAPAEMRERRGEVVAKLKTLQARPPALTLAAGGLSVVGCQRQCAVRAPRLQTSAPTVAALARLRACETRALGRCAQAQAESIVAFLSNEGHVKQLKQDKAYNLGFLQEVFQIGPAQIDALFHYAKFQFDCGNYSVAAEFLYHYRCGRPRRAPRHDPCKLVVHGPARLGPACLPADTGRAELCCGERRPVPFDVAAGSPLRWARAPAAARAERVGGGRGGRPAWRAGALAAQADTCRARRRGKLAPGEVARRETLTQHVIRFPVLATGVARLRQQRCRLSNASVVRGPPRS